MKGRRLPVIRGQRPAPELPGDYCGPVYGYTGNKYAVFFLKPHARDPDTPPRGRIIHHVVSPPHTFIEEDDGTLTIRASIGDTSGPGSQSDGWHGFLERGIWRKA